MQEVGFVVRRHELKSRNGYVNVGRLHPQKFEFSAESHWHHRDGDVKQELVDTQRCRRQLHCLIQNRANVVIVDGEAVLDLVEVECDDARENQKLRRGSPEVNDQKALSGAVDGTAPQEVDVLLNGLEAADHRLHELGIVVGRIGVI